jgi:hypothetical protein
VHLGQADTGGDLALGEIAAQPKQHDVVLAPAQPTECRGDAEGYLGLLVGGPVGGEDLVRGEPAALPAVVCRVQRVRPVGGPGPLCLGDLARVEIKGARDRLDPRPRPRARPTWRRSSRGSPRPP